MKKLLFSAVAVLGMYAVVGNPAPVQAEVLYRWCSTAPDDGNIRNCAFNTQAQCLATISGIGGRCLANPQFRLQRDSRFLEAPMMSPNRVR